MKWQKIDNHTEHREVIMLNDRNDVLIGRAHYSHSRGSWEGEDDNTVITNVTHFIPLKELLKLDRE